MYREQTDWPLSPTWPGKAVPVAGSRAALLEGLWEGDIACRSSLLLCLKRQIPACFWDEARKCASHTPTCTAFKVFIHLNANTRAYTLVAFQLCLWQCILLYIL